MHQTTCLHCLTGDKGVQLRKRLRLQSWTPLPSTTLSGRLPRVNIVKVIAGKPVLYSQRGIRSGNLDRLIGDDIVGMARETGAVSIRNHHE